MAKPKRIRNLLIGILKDKISLTKATLFLAVTRTASFHRAVLRETSHNPFLLPRIENLSDDVLALSWPNAGALVHALLQRVHHTSNAYVALKCLVTFHHVISCGPHLVDDQIICLTNVGPLFKLSNFRDQSDVDTWELSNWIRWYAVVLDYKISFPLTKSLKLLINFVEKISRAPDSLHYQKFHLVYEIMKLIGEEYRIVLREIYSKMEEIRTRIGNFRIENLEMLLADLKRIENCKEKLLLMFLNKKKNDGFWELMENVRQNVEDQKLRRDSSRQPMGTRGTRGLNVGSNPFY